MKMKSTVLVAVLAMVFVAACTPSIVLVGDVDKDNQTVRDHVAIGTPVDKAVQVMSTAGFKCQVRRNQTVTLVKAMGPVGEIPNSDFIQCTRQENSRDWTVALVLDKGDIIRDVSVTSKPIE